MLQILENSFSHYRPEFHRDIYDAFELSHYNRKAISRMKFYLNIAFLEENGLNKQFCWVADRSHHTLMH